MRLPVAATLLRLILLRFLLLRLHCCDNLLGFIFATYFPTSFLLRLNCCGNLFLLIFAFYFDTSFLFGSIVAIFCCASLVAALFAMRILVAAPCCGYLAEAHFAADLLLRLTCCGFLGYENPCYGSLLVYVFRLFVAAYFDIAPVAAPLLRIPLL